MKIAKNENFHTIRIILWLWVMAASPAFPQSISQNLVFALDGLSYPSITGPCNLRFFEDHGAHPDYRTEWWYYTGNLQSESGGHYGFQLTFFRSRISPPGAESNWPEPASAWRSRQLFLAHAAISDIDGKRFYHAEDAARATLGMAGVDQQSDLISVFLKNWSARLTPDTHFLSAKADDFALELALEPLKGPVAHGESGYSLKGRNPESASCYYSFTRMKTEGILTIMGKTFQVKGSSWMDHEFSSAPLEPDLVGWDWFSLQFDNNTELMIYLLRQKDGTYSPASGGTFVDPSGKSSRLTREEIHMEVLDHWKSSGSEAVYPSGWRLGVKRLGLDLVINPGLKDQEMQTPESTRVTYWEGSVGFNGMLNYEPVSGRGYVELTGYAKPLDAPL